MDEYSRVKSEQISALPFTRAQWGGRTLHYDEFIEWLSEQIHSSKLTRAIRILVDGHDNCVYTVFHKELVCLFLRNTPLNSATFTAKGYLVFRLLLDGEMTQRIGSEPREMSGFESSVLSTGDTASGWTSVTSTHEGATGLVILCADHFLKQKLYALGGVSTEIGEKLRVNGDISYSRQKVQATPAMVQLSKALMALDLERDPGLLHCEGLILQLLSEFLFSLRQTGHDASAITQFSRRDIQQLNLARSLIEEHYASNMTITEVAKQVGLNRTKLSEGFSELFGVTVHGYIIEKRMDAAIDMLRDGRALQEIAIHAGYQSAASFCRAFKQHFGSTPGEFKRSLN